MARWRSGIERTVKDQVGTVLSVVVELSEKVAASKAEAQIFELTTRRASAMKTRCTAWSARLRRHTGTWLSR